MTMGNAVPFVLTLAALLVLYLGARTRPTLAPPEADYNEYAGEHATLLEVLDAEGTPVEYELIEGGELLAWFAADHFDNARAGYVATRYEEPFDLCRSEYSDGEDVAE